MAGRTQASRDLDERNSELTDEQVQAAIAEHDGRAVAAVTFDTLLSERLDAASLSEIDGSWLSVAHG